MNVDFGDMEPPEFADTRGADKIIYAGYSPLGLTLERIFGELEDVSVSRPHVA